MFFLISKRDRHTTAPSCIAVINTASVILKALAFANIFRNQKKFIRSSRNIISEKFRLDCASKKHILTRFTKDCIINNNNLPAFQSGKQI